MSDQVEELRTRAIRELTAISDSKELESWRIQYLGKKSDLTLVLRSLGSLPLE